MSLARVFTVFCKIRKDLQTARTFCYDALFCLGLKAYALVFIVLSVWPEVFRKKSKEKDADILESSILIALVELKTAQRNKDTKVVPVQSIIKNSYRYQDQLVKSEDLIKKLMIDMRGIKKVEGAEPATILLCKKKGWEWTHRNLLCQNLVSIFEDYEWGKVTVNAAAAAVKLIGFISRSCSTETAGPVKPIIDYLFEAIKKQEKYPMVIQEAIVHSLICLSRFYLHRASTALDLWTPKTYPSEELINKMTNLVCHHQVMFWRKYFGQWRKKLRMPKDVLVPNTLGVYCTDADLSTLLKNGKTDSTEVEGESHLEEKCDENGEGGVSKGTNGLKTRGGKAGHLRGRVRYRGSTSRTVHRNARWVGMLRQQSDWLQAEEKKWEEIAWVKRPGLPNAERCEVQKLIEYSETMFN